MLKKSHAGRKIGNSRRDGVSYLLKLMESQVTVREFKSDPVPSGHLEKILKAASRAPSGANAQPWDFIIVQDPEMKRKIAEVFVYVQKKSKRLDRCFPHHSPEAMWKRLTCAPVLIVVCADSRFKRAYPKFGYREEILNVSMGAAIQNMMLTAHALGLGLSWGTVGILGRDRLRKLLGVPPHIRVLEVLQLGYPAKRVSPGFRRDPKEFTHLEKLDVSKLRRDEEIKKLLSTRKSPDIYSGENIARRRQQGD
jgi:5,6-dimethylbenzimidazole synthase